MKVLGYALLFASTTEMNHKGAHEMCRVAEFANALMTPVKPPIRIC